MRPVSNPTHQTPNLLSRISTRTLFKLLTVCLIVAAVPVAVYVRVKSAASVASSTNFVELTRKAKGGVTVQAAGRGKPFLNLRDGQDMTVTYRGDRAAATALQSGAAQARSLASADFDRNGTPDVVAGYSYNGGGIITLQRGNPDAFAPADDSVLVRMQQGYNPDSLLPGADVYSVPVSPDFIVTGNFTKGSAPDVVFAAKGGALYLMKGNGSGKLGAPAQIDLPGPVTALAAGEFRAPDGGTDLAVGVSAPGGDALLIFDGAEEGFTNPLAQYQLSGPASGIEFGSLDDDPYTDIAVADGGEVTVVHGWGRKENVTPESRVEKMNVGSSMRGLALGDFEWDRQGHSEIAALTSDGTVHIVANGKNDTRPFTAAEAAQRTRGNLKIQRSSKPVDVESTPGWRAGAGGGWKDDKQILGSNLSSDLPKPIIKTNLAGKELDEMMLIGQAQSQLELLRPLSKTDSALTANQSLAVTNDTAKVTMDTQRTPVAAQIGRAHV